MKFSISLRYIFFMNIVVAIFAAVVGYSCSHIAGQFLRAQLVDEVVENAASMLGNMNVDPRPGVMKHLAQIFGVDTIAYDPQKDKVLASSLDSKTVKSIEGKIKKIFKQSQHPTFEMNNKQFIVGAHKIEYKSVNGDRPAGTKLLVLVPRDKLDNSQQQINQRIADITIIALLIVTFATVLISLTVTRPIRKLSHEMDSISTEIQTQDNAGDLSNLKLKTIRGPAEVSALANSFYRLLNNLKNAEAKLAKSERLASLGKISASVAHELRNPLSGIKMNVRILHDEIKKSQAQEDLETISREIDRMDLYLQELMCIATQSTGKSRKMKLMPNMISISQQYQEVVNILQGRIKHANVSIVTDFELDCDRVFADASAVRQVIMNFLINAIEAMPDGGEIKISTVKCEIGTEFAIQDSGTGIQLTQDLFEPFISSKFDGAGLGLHICKQILDSSAGEIGYRNLEKGAKFWFRLPNQAI